MTNESVPSLEECLELLGKEEIKPRELRRLIAARDEGVIDFCLVDIRDGAKHKIARIRGTDGRFETAETISLFVPQKERAIVLYCQSGMKSKLQVKPLKALGYKNISSLAYGLLGYQGEIEKD